MRIVRPFTVLVAFVLLTSCATVRQPPPTGDLDEWTSLVNGNTSFRTGSLTFNGLRQRYESQNPPITILACSDSRVPPELVFYQSLNRVFIVRTAGNVADEFGIASIEYAIKKRWTRLLVILAHEKCGAVEAAILPDPPPPEQTPSLNALVGKIRESFLPPSCTITQSGCWTRRTRENALNAVDDLKEHSEVIRKAIEVDRLPVVVVYYGLDGRITGWGSVNTTIPTE